MQQTLNPRHSHESCYHTFDLTEKEKILIKKKIRLRFKDKRI